MSNLTERQREVMQMVAEGKTNQQIASELNLKEQTIKNLLNRTYTRLDAKNRVSAVLKFIKES